MKKRKNKGVEVDGEKSVKVGIKKARVQKYVVRKNDETKTYGCRSGNKKEKAPPWRSLKNKA